MKLATIALRMYMLDIFCMDKKFEESMHNNCIKIEVT